MAEDEGVPINKRRVGHLPGDRVLVERGFFRHEMNLKEVFAVFEHEESHEPFEMTLRDHYLTMPVLAWSLNGTILPTRKVPARISANRSKPA